MKKTKQRFYSFRINVFLKFIITLIAIKEKFNKKVLTKSKKYYIIIL